MYFSLNNLICLTVFTGASYSQENYILHPLENKTVLFGEDFNISCSSHIVKEDDGIAMYKGMEPIYTNYPNESIDDRFEMTRYRLNDSDERFVLGVEEADFGDAGIYSCELVNYGSRRQRCFITILRSDGLLLQQDEDTMITKVRGSVSVVGKAEKSLIKCKMSESNEDSTNNIPRIHMEPIKLAEDVYTYKYVLEPPARSENSTVSCSWDGIQVGQISIPPVVGQSTERTSTSEAGSEAGSEAPFVSPEPSANIIILVTAAVGVGTLVVTITVVIVYCLKQSKKTSSSSNAQLPTPAEIDFELQVQQDELVKNMQCEPYHEYAEIEEDDYLKPTCH